MLMMMMMKLLRFYRDHCATWPVLSVQYVRHVVMFLNFSLVWYAILLNVLGVGTHDGT